MLCFFNSDNKINNHHQPVDSGQPTNSTAVVHWWSPDLNREQWSEAVDPKTRQKNDSWTANPGPKM